MSLAQVTLKMDKDCLRGEVSRVENGIFFNIHTQKDHKEPGFEAS